MFIVKDGSILDATEDYICHQTNCISQGEAAGVARAIFKAYPYADVYKNRNKPDRPGTIAVCGGYDDTRGVVNMHAQYYPGRPNCFERINDDAKIRRNYFRKCLFETTKQLPDSSFAFPWGIGCGLAQGDWGEYITILKNFESYIEGNVTIYKLPI
jgi:hypothetical protein